jgi:hypothetical protein
MASDPGAVVAIGPITMSKRLFSIAARQNQGLVLDKLFAVAVAFASAVSLVALS